MTKRILVVEDQEDLRAILRDLLAASGYDVIEAVDGGAGVAKALSNVRRAPSLPSVKPPSMVPLAAAPCQIRSAHWHGEYGRSIA